MTLPFKMLRLFNIICTWWTLIENGISPENVQALFSVLCIQYAIISIEPCLARFALGYHFARWASRNPSGFQGMERPIGGRRPKKSDAPWRCLKVLNICSFVLQA